jgi:hypothetical protein
MAVILLAQQDRENKVVSYGLNDCEDNLFFGKGRPIFSRLQIC